jgi:5-hydroxyisourate hydrolase
VSCSLSTHVLDTAAGRPAAGVSVELRAGDDVVASAETDADGRARLADGLEPGQYVVAFTPPSPFFRRIELTIELEDGHYHVPLLVSPYGCATYRGS